MNYIFCGAYESLLFALYIKEMGGKITIVTDNNNIVKYCEMETIDYIKFEKISITTPTIYKVFSLKKILDNALEKMVLKNSDHFYLTTESKAYNAFYLAKELSKKGVVYFYNPGRKPEKYKHPKNKPFFIRGEIIRFVLKLFLNLDLIYYNSRGSPCFGINDTFMKKHNITKYKLDVSSDKIGLIVAKRSNLNFKKFDNLIISQGTLHNTIKFDSLKNIYRNILNIPVEFAFKKHPVQKSNKLSDLSFHNIFEKCYDIPEYIPVEMIFNNIKKNVISVYSVSLINASKFKHLKSTSLLELVDWGNKAFKKEIKNYLITESNNNICFPKNIKELEKIILN